MLYATSSDVNVVPYAERQDAKLVRGLESQRTPAGAGRTPSIDTTPAEPGSFVTIEAVTGAEPGGLAGVSVRTNPGASCGIEYRTPLGTLATADGLEPKTADADGRVSWSWRIEPGSERGAGSVRVTCDGRAETAPVRIG